MPENAQPPPEKMASTGGEQIKFSVMVSLFNWIQKTKPAAKKRSKFRKFLDAYCKKPEDYFSTIRLILPSLDRERGSYGLKEHVLATSLVDALGMSRDSPDAIRLINWRKGGPKAGAFAGNFSLVAADVLQSRLGSISGEITVKELNDLLDRLASSENRGEKNSVLSDLIRKTNAQEMKWIIMIILKDLKLGISEKSIFHEFHPDAEDLFNVTCDLKLVCEKLRDRTQRHKRQDIEVGKPVRPQLALRVSNAAAAWKRLHGKEVVVECKFDGDRIQLHKNKTEIHFYSRNFLDHQEYAHGMSDIIAKNILVDRCILDGEMLVWDTSTNRFAEFGSNQEIAKAAKEGLDSDRQLCYVAFDILYVGDTSVIHQSLKERHELLRQVVRPIKGRLEILIPHGGLNAHRPPGEPCWSLITCNVDAVEKFFRETIENRDEGIVLKDLGSKWEPSDRSGKWMKLKPEYVRAGSDLDVLIIGGYYGSGRHGGEVAQFLVGLAERPAPNTCPRRFLSFCRVGTGLSDEELSSVVSKLKPYFRKNEYPKKKPPSFYQVTNHSKERPDVWIESPEKSVVLTITSDIRTIDSEVFAAPYSLRFPRIDHVRLDKPWHECLDVESFVELVHSSNGTTQKAADYSSTQDHKPKCVATSRREKRNISALPSHFIQTDISQIKSETSLFSNMVFYPRTVCWLISAAVCVVGADTGVILRMTSLIQALTHVDFVNVPSSHSLDSLHKMVVEHGGTFSMNLNNSVTHCIAAESKGIKFQGAKLHGDVIHCSWLFGCCSLKKLLPLQPKYFLFLSESTKKKLQEEIDEFSDSYFLDINLADLRQLLSNVDRTEDSKEIAYYKKKYCPKDKWMQFHDCCIYFYLPLQYSENLDWKVILQIALRRMKLEVSFGGGKVGDNLSHATHLVVMSLPDTLLDFNVLLSSFSTAEKCLLHCKRVHVVSSQWLEDCFKSEQKLPEQTYSLRPTDLEQSMSEESDHCPASEENISSDKEGNLRERKAVLGKSRIVTLPLKSRRKSGRGNDTSTGEGKARVKRPRRTRARIGSKPAKIIENESDGSAASNDQSVNKLSDRDTEPHGGHDMVHEDNKKNRLDEAVNVSGSSETVKTPGDAAEYNGYSDRYNETRGSNCANEDGNKNEEKSVRTEDPVQTMLLDMIPSLGSKKRESSDPVPRDDKLLPDPNPNPEKKRKVSYKDVADELLKDW